jgi:hypothetical protein
MSPRHTHLLSELPQVFNSRKGDEQKTLEEERDRLFQQIGQLQYELAWLKKKSAWTTDQKRSAIEVNEPCLSVRRQCDLLGLSRGSWNYTPRGENEENLQLMRPNRSVMPGMGSIATSSTITMSGRTKLWDIGLRPKCMLSHDI